MKIFFVCLAMSLAVSAAPPLNFSRDVLPSLEKSCFKCHSGKIKKPKAKLRLDRKKDLLEFEGLIKAGKPSESSIVTLIDLPKGHDDIMPPAEKAPELTKKEISRIRLWVEQGAHFGDWIEYIDNSKVKTVSGLKTDKEVESESEAVHQLDLAIEKSLKHHALKMNPPVSDETFLRRIFLQIIGRNPTYEEATKFLSSNDPGKREKLIVNLQNSEGYVSNNFNYWANILRVQSRQKGNIKNSWINYLKDSLRKNTHYDDFVKELISAAGSSWDNPQIGFYGRDMKNRLAGYESLTAVFLGTQIGCAQCHDHPYDTTTRRDYFEMFAFIYGVHAQERRKKIFKHVDPQEIYKDLRKIDQSIKKKKPMFGGMTRSVNIHAQVNFREILFKVYSGTVKKYWSVLPPDYQYDDGKPKGFVMPDVLFGESPKVKIEDNPQKIFAQWVTSPENLKFTHVIVNRLWHKAFGKTLMGSLVDIKPVEQSPVKELSEHLAQLMVSLDYDMKKFNRILYKTKLYQSEAVKDDLAAMQKFIQGPAIRRLSAEQVWDSLMSLIVHDLDSKLKPQRSNFDFMKELVEVKTKDEFWAKIKQKAKDEPIDIGKGTRMMRAVQKAGFLESDFKRASELRQPTPPGHFLRQFGQADRELVEDQWKNPTVPQSLTLLNSPLVKKILSKNSSLLAVVEQAEGKNQKINAVYLSVLGRRPSIAELSKIQSSIQRNKDFKVEDLAWILVNTREFLFSK